MAFTNYSTKEINCKVVYYGPTGSGKTTNLHSIYSQVSAEKNSQLSAFEMARHHTAYFDFLPISAGFYQNFHIKLHLYTLPSTRFFEHSRRLILKGVDGVVFVADSQLELMDANKMALKELQSTLALLGLDIQKLPLLFQYNKRDAKSSVNTPIISRLLNRLKLKEFEAVASEHIGTMDTFTEITKLVLSDIKTGAEAI